MHATGFLDEHEGRDWAPYAVAAGLAGVGLIVTKALASAPNRPGFMFFLAAVALATWVGRMVGGLFTLLLSTVLSVYYLLSPMHSFFVDDAADQTRLVAFVLTGFVVCGVLGSWPTRRETAAAPAPLVIAGVSAKPAQTIVGLGSQAELIASLEALGEIPSVVAVDSAGALQGDFRGLKRAGLHSVLIAPELPQFLRRQLWNVARLDGLKPVSVRHATAVVAASARVGEGAVFLARAIVNPGAQIGDNVVLGCGSIVEHDCVLGDHVRIASGAILGAGVHVGAGSEIRARGIIRQNVKIGENATVLEGAVVVRDVPSNTVVSGVPAAAVTSEL